MVIAELGVYWAEFSRQIMSTPYSKLYLVDVWSGFASSADKDGRNNTEDWDTFGTYMRLVNEFSDKQNIQVIRGRTADFLKHLPDNYLDCVYIDSDHSYPTVIEELRLSLKKVNPGGWITGHDYVDLTPGVIQAVDEFLKETGFKMEYLTEDGCPSYFIRNEKAN